MKEREILEGNRLLAEFMGLTHIESYITLWIEKNVSDTPISFSEILDKERDNLTYISKLKFNSDWNWLMEVVEKINSLGHIFSIELHPEYERLKSKNYNRVEILHNEDRHIYRDSTISFNTPVIESVWKACVTFVKWYNENNEP